MPPATRSGTTCQKQALANGGTSRPVGWMPVDSTKFRRSRQLDRRNVELSLMGRRSCGVAASAVESMPVDLTIGGTVGAGEAICEYRAGSVRSADCNAGTVSWPKLERIRSDSCIALIRASYNRITSHDRCLPSSKLQSGELGSTQVWISPAGIELALQHPPADEGQPHDGDSRNVGRPYVPSSY